MTIGPGASYSDDGINNDIKQIDLELHQHLATEGHPMTVLKLDQISKELHDIEKELSDLETQDKEYNKNLNEIKLILCSNALFNCNIDIN